MKVVIWYDVTLKLKIRRKGPQLEFLNFFFFFFQKVTEILVSYGDYRAANSS